MFASFTKESWKDLINNEKLDVELSALYEAYFRSNKRISRLILNVKDFDVNKKN